MNGLLNEMTSLLAGLVMLMVAMAVVPFLLKVGLPPVGEPLWRGYWRLVRWVLIAPMRLLTAIFRPPDRRR